MTNQPQMTPEKEAHGRLLREKTQEVLFEQPVPYLRRRRSDEMSGE
jgi:hypothetical protein